MKKHEVPESVLAEAKDCPYEISCVSTGKCGDRELCEIESANGKNVLFLTSKEPAQCLFRVLFADGLLCACPVHYWLYQQENRSGGV